MDKLEIIEDLAEFVFRDEDNSYNLPSGAGSSSCSCCCTAVSTSAEILEEDVE
jgi:hypothetical protein